MNKNVIESLMVVNNHLIIPNYFIKYYKKFDSLLKSIDEEYRATIINFGKYKLVMFAMAKIMEMETTEQNIENVVLQLM